MIEAARHSTPGAMKEFVLSCLRDPAYNKAEACRATGLVKSTLSEIGSGEQPNPSIDLIDKLYQYFTSLPRKNEGVKS